MLRLPPARLLVVKLGSIGDVVNTLPLVNVLKTSWPETTLAWLIEPKSYPIVAGHRSVDRFIVFHREERLNGVRAALAEVKDFAPEMVIDLQRILRSGFFTLFSGASSRLGFDRKRCKELSWIFTNFKIPPTPNPGHMVRQYLEFASYLKLNWEEIDFQIPLSDRALEKAKDLLPPRFLKDGFIALNIGAAKPANRWPEVHWAALSRRFQGEGVNIVLTGGRQDRARARLIRTRSGKETVDLTGRTTLNQLAALFSLARTVVSADTGPMHIASALGTRTIGLFGPADPRRTGPFNFPDEVIISPAECRFCGKRSCRHRRCMEEITPEMVYRRLKT